MTKWSKRRRLEAVIRGEKPDRPPVALWRHWPGDDQDAAALAAAHIKWQHDYDWDLLKVGPDSNYSVADWGVEDRWIGHIEGTRETTRWPVHDPQDWAGLPVLDPGRGKLAMQIEALAAVRQEVGEEVPVLATIFSPLSQAKHLAGKETLAGHLHSHPDLLHAALDTITKSTIRFIEAAKGAGIDGVYYAVQHARYPLMSRAEFSEFGRSYDLRVLESAADLWLNMLHIHSTDIMFDLVADYPVPLVNWHDRESGVSLREGLAQISGAASGGINQWTIHQESPEQTLAEARDALEQTDGRRLVLGTGCVVMATTPLRNLRALREFAEQ
ncbi:MAG: uroporphyrinogen decarboxylase family protein [Candidatus Promineifilaceae bacterium]|jgi:uroporphyrinogen decarboxylase